MNSDLPQRKAPRLQNYDYSSAGTYFITICTKNKAKILCSFVGAGVLDSPKSVFTDRGKIVDAALREMSDYYTHIKIEKYVVMPNHIHFLLNIIEDNGASRTPPPTSDDETAKTKRASNAAVPMFVSTLKRRINHAVGENIWQRSFHDHIIRDERDYLRIWEYIDTNPIKWQDDCFYTPE